MRRSILLSLLTILCCAINAQEENDPYEKFVVLEEFTTEICPNCPRGASVINEALSDPELKGKVIPITHHAGFYEDWLTTEADQQYLWFFGSRYTYAPAIMFDRYPFFFTDEGYEIPVSQIEDAKFVKKFIKKRLRTKSHLRLDITGDFDNNETLTVRVNGERNKVFTEMEPRITVYVVEDNLPAQSQAGAKGQYKHSHVMRGYNHVWGDAIVWNGDTFNYECNIKIDPTWNKDNLEIVAFVSTLDVDDQAACSIENARVIPFAGNTGIEDVNINKELVKTEYFTADGIATSDEVSGLYIEKKMYNDGSVEIRKINR